MAASNRGHIKAVDILLQRGANPHMQDHVRRRKIEITSVLNLPVPVCVCSVCYLSVCILLSTLLRLAGLRCWVQCTWEMMR